MLNLPHRSLKFSRFLRGSVGFFLFVILQFFPSPAYSQSSLSGLNQCSNPANASVCSQLFGVKESILTANAPGTNSLATLMGRVGTRFSSIGNLNIGAAVNSKVGYAAGVAGVAGLGAATLWGVDWSRLQAIRAKAYEEYCSVNLCGAYSVFYEFPSYGSDIIPNPNSKNLYVHYPLTGAYELVSRFQSYAFGSLYIGSGHRLTICYVDLSCSFGAKVFWNTDLKFYSLAAGASDSGWDSLSDAQKQSAIEALNLSDQDLAGLLRGQSLSLPSGYDAFDLVAGAGVEGFGDSARDDDRLAPSTAEDAEGASDSCYLDANCDGVVDSDANGDGVINETDQAAKDAKDEESKTREEEKAENLAKYDEMLPEIAACGEGDGASKSIYAYAKCKLSDNFPFDFLGELPETSAPSSCPEFSFFGQSYEFCFIDNLFLALKWVIWIAFSIKGVLAL